MQLHPDDLAALGLMGGQQQPDPYAVGGYNLDALAAAELPGMPPPAAPQPSAPVSAEGDKIVGKPDIMAHLETVMRAGAQGTLAAPSGLVKAGETVRTTDDGRTPEQRASSVAVRGQAELDTAAVDQNRLTEDAKTYEAKAAELRAQADVENEKREAEEHKINARMSRIREHQEFLAEQRDEPVNSQRYFQNGSLFGKAMALISAFSYGFLNTKNQGVAPIMQELTRMADLDTREQIANNADSRARRSDLIALYERRYGDATLVSKKLEADKLQTMGKKALADATEAKSAQAKAAANDLGQKLLIAADVKNKQVEEAYGAQPVERTTTYAPAKGKGDASANIKKALETDKLLEQQGYSREQRASALKAMGLPPPQGTTAAEAERTDKLAAADAKAKELTSDEKKDLRERTDGLANAVHGFEELDKTAGIVRNKNGDVVHARTDLSDTLSPGVSSSLLDMGDAVPFKMGRPISNLVKGSLPSDSQAMRRSVEKITTGMVHAESGAGASDGEMQRAADRFPVNSSKEFLRASEEYHREQKQKYMNLAAKYGRANVDADLKARGIDPARFGGD
jgi:hypothetical protein